MFPYHRPMVTPAPAEASNTLAFVSLALALVPAVAVTLGNIQRNLGFSMFEGPVGILFLLGGITELAAVITGHIALAQAKRYQITKGHQVWAIVALILSYPGVAFYLLLYLFIAGVLRIVPS
jgi:hypothetical protein